MAAQRTDWQTKPAPERRADLGYEADFDDTEAEKLREGLVPQAMEDKWFIFAEGDWLYLHRSWTGVLVYAVRLDGTSTGVRVVESWVNRDPEQYTGTDVAYDRALVDFLLRTQLLGKPAEFPIRPQHRDLGLGTGRRQGVVARRRPQRPGQGVAGLLFLTVQELVAIVD